MPGDTFSKVDPAAQIRNLISEQPELFATQNRERLRAEILGLTVTASALTAAKFDDSIFVSIGKLDDLSEVELGRLSTVWHLCEAEYFRRRKSTPNSESEAEEEEEPEEEVAPDETEGEDEETNADKIRAKLGDYTFIPEIQRAYTGLQQRNPVILIVHTKTIYTKEKVSDGWESMKSKVKAVLSACGLEGIFLCIDYAAEKSIFLKLTLKTIGSIIVPFFVAYTIISFVLKILTNPFKHALNWLAREFEIKTEPEPET